MVRWQAPRVWVMVGMVVIAAVAIFAFSPTIERKLLGKTPSGVTQVSSITELKAAFNRDVGSTRLVLIFSPT